MVLIQNISGSSNIRSDRQIIDMASKIAWLEPDAYPLLSLTRRLSKAVSLSYEFKALEMDVQSRTTPMAANAGAAAVALTVTDYTIFRAADILENTRTHEKVRVSTTPTAAAVTVVRSVGTTAAANMLTGDELLIIGNAHSQGASLGTPLTQQTDLFTNYLLNISGGSKSWLYARTPEYPEIPKCKNVQVRKTCRKDYLVEVYIQSSMNYKIDRILRDQTPTPYMGMTESALHSDMQLT